MKKLINFIKSLFTCCKYDCRESLSGIAVKMGDTKTDKKLRVKNKDV